MADPSETTQISRLETEPRTDELLGAVRSLAAQVDGLQHDVHALRRESRGLPADGERAGWDEGQQPVLTESPSWVRSVDSPAGRGLAVPWLLLEILFLVAVAVLSAVADLDAPVIAGVMVGAWILVAAGEWIAWRAETSRRTLLYGDGPAPASLPDDPRWFRSSEDAAIEAAPETRSTTRLPPPQPE